MVPRDNLIYDFYLFFKSKFWKLIPYSVIVFGICSYFVFTMPDEYISISSIQIESSDGFSFSQSDADSTVQKYTSQTFFGEISSEFGIHKVVLSNSIKIIPLVSGPEWSADRELYGINVSVSNTDPSIAQDLAIYISDKIVYDRNSITTNKIDEEISFLRNTVSPLNAQIKNTEAELNSVLRDNIDLVNGNETMIRSKLERLDLEISELENGIEQRPTDQKESLLSNLLNERNELSIRLTDLPTVDLRLQSLERTLDLLYSNLSTVSMDLFRAEQMGTLQHENRGFYFSILDPANLPEKDINMTKILILISASLIASLFPFFLLYMKKHITKTVTNSNDFEMYTGIKPSITIPII